VARPEGFEPPAFWFVGRWSKTSKRRYWYRLRAKRATYSALKLDGSWTEPNEVNPYDGTNSLDTVSAFIKAFSYLVAEKGSVEGDDVAPLIANELPGDVHPE